jgi:hypothetical protein
MSDIVYGGGGYHEDEWGPLHVGETYRGGYTVQRTKNVWHGSAMSYLKEVKAYCTSPQAAEAALRLLSL